MKNETFAKLAASIKEAGEIKAGHQAPSRIYEIKPPEIRMVRERLDVSQGEFAVMIGVSARTLQNWEQGRRQPRLPKRSNRYDSKTGAGVHSPRLNSKRVTSPYSTIHSGEKIQ